MTGNNATPINDFWDMNASIATSDNIYAFGETNG